MGCDQRQFGCAGDGLTIDVLKGQCLGKEVR